MINLRDIPLSWITVGDLSVCPDCQEKERQEPRSMDEWIASGGVPGSADTACGDKCRCDLEPTAESDLEKEAERLIDESCEEIFKSFGFDLSKGGGLRLPVLIDEWAKIPGVEKMTADMAFEMEELIVEWKIKNDGAKFPPSFLDIQDMGKMIEWLRKEV